MVGVLLLAFLVLASCSKGGPGQAASGSSSDGTYQMKDPNVNAPGVFPVVKEPITLSLGLRIFTQVSDYDDNVLTKYLENLTGIKLNFVFYDQGADGEMKLNLQVAAGEPIPDLVFRVGIGTAAVREAFGRAGAIIPLQDYIKNLGYYTNPAVDAIQIYKDMGVDPWSWGRDEDGNIWAFMFYEAVFANANSGRAWYNGDFAKRFGMSEDEWTGGKEGARLPTQDWFVKYLRNVRDNIPNGIPLTGNTGWRANMLPWLTQQYIFNDYASTEMFWLVKNNQLEYFYNQPEYREALRFINGLYKEKLWDETALTQPNYNMIANQDPLIVGVAVGGHGTDVKNRPTQRPLPIVQGPQGQINVNYWVHTPQFQWAISSNCKYPEAAFRWLDAQASDPDFAIFPRYGEKGVNWRPIQPGEPGLYGDFGPNEPYVVELIDIWGDNQRVHWRDEFGIDYMNRKSAMGWNGDPLFGEYMLAWCIQGMVPHRPAIFPILPSFTSAENEQWAETRTALRNYVNQSMALFATGQLDPNNDRDWNDYMANLETLGASKLLEMDRNAHNRMWGAGWERTRQPVVFKR